MANVKDVLGNITWTKLSHVVIPDKGSISWKEELMDMVDGTTPKPPPIDIANIVAWIKKDNQAVHLLCQNVEEKILKYIMSYRTSKAICNKLKEMHDQWSHESIHHIQQRFFDITVEEGESIFSFLGKFEEARNEFYQSKKQYFHR
jgi:hypothetical protein